MCCFAMSLGLYKMTSQIAVIKLFKLIDPADGKFLSETMKENDAMLCEYGRPVDRNKSHKKLELGQTCLYRFDPWTTEGMVPYSFVQALVYRVQ